MAQRNLKARYRTIGPKRENVKYTRCFIDENGALQQEPAEEEMECYYVYFPHGHSIRVTSYDKLKELGYHIKPRIVDMDTGDLVDIGGDPYDFAGADSYEQGVGHASNETIVLDEDITGKAAKRRTADANA